MIITSSLVLIDHHIGSYLTLGISSPPTWKGLNLTIDDFNFLKWLGSCVSWQFLSFHRYCHVQIGTSPPAWIGHFDSSLTYLLKHTEPQRMLCDNHGREVENTSMLCSNSAYSPQKHSLGTVRLFGNTLKTTRPSLWSWLATIGFSACPFQPIWLEICAHSHALVVSMLRTTATNYNARRISNVGQSPPPAP